VRNYYEILDLPDGASKQEIKKAYRKLAFKFHPDKNKSEGSDTRFLEISEAYEMLMSPISKNFKKQSKEQQKKQREDELKKARERAKENLRKRYNDLKKQEEKEQSKQYVIGIYIFVSIVLLIIVSYSSYYAWFNNQAYANSDTVLGHVTFVDYRSFNIKFQTAEKLYDLNKNGDRSFEDLNGKNGMPLEIGEEFLVVYNKKQPEYFDVLYKPLTRQTFRIYEQITTAKIEMWLKENNHKYDEYRANCMFHLLFKEFGVDGIAHMYFYNEPLIENTKHNSWNFESFRNQQVFINCVNFCQQ